MGLRIDTELFELAQERFVVYLECFGRLALVSAGHTEDSLNMAPFDLVERTVREFFHLKSAWFLGQGLFYFIPCNCSLAGTHHHESFHDVPEFPDGAGPTV